RRAVARGPPDAALGPRHAHPLGFLLERRRALLLLAAAARPAAGARLRGRARALPHPRPGSLAPLLGAGRGGAAGLAGAGPLAPHPFLRGRRVPAAPSRGERG